MGRWNLQLQEVNDQSLTGDLRVTMGGFRTGAGRAVGLSGRVFSPFKLPEPVALSGQGDQRYTYIRECGSSLWVWKLISKCNFAK